MDYFYNATHESFQSMIGLTYTFPIQDAWNYSSVCNAAIGANLKVEAMLDDGVVYTIITQTILRP